MASHPVLSRFRNVRAIVMDVDGVLTDNSLLVSNDGSELRTMNARDGYAIQLAAKKGLELCVITGGNSEGVNLRLHKLGVQSIFPGVTNKSQTYLFWLNQKHIPSENVIYIGDDMVDMEVMNLTGVPCCPADACSEIIAICEYISPSAGGKGCVRDIIEKVLKLQGKWE